MEGKTAAERENIMRDAVDRLEIAVLELLEIAETVEPDNTNLTFVKQVVKTARYLHTRDVMDKVKNYLTLYAPKIMERDAMYFAEADLKVHIKNDGNKEFLHVFIGMIQRGIKKLKPQELAIVWGLMDKMIAAVAEFRLADPNDPINKL